MVEQLILDVTDGTTSKKYGDGAGLSTARSGLFCVQFDCDAASSVTAVTVGLVGSRDGSDGSWVPLLAYKASDTSGTPAQTATLTATTDASTFDALMTENVRGWPFVAVTYQATGANFHAGDRLRVWFEP